MKSGMPKSKRLRFAVYVFHVYMALGVFGIVKQTDLTALGTFCALTSFPLLAYILGDTFRPSNLTDINK